jgi:hypothetical protein
MSDGLVPPLNAPPGISPYPGVQPGTNSNIIRARQVIVSGPGDGVFVYDGTPGLGNPPIAWMGGGLVDPYGNVLPSATGVTGSGTFTVDGADGGFIELADVGGVAVLGLYASGLAHLSHPSQIFTSAGNGGDANESQTLLLFSGSETGSAGSASIQLSSDADDGSTIAVVNLAITGVAILGVTASYIIAAKPVNAANPVSGGLESWHSMPAFGTGFSHGTPAPAYKLNPDNTVSLAGEVSAGSGTTSGTIVTLPAAAYFPISAKRFPVALSGGTPATTGSAHIGVDTSGDITLASGPTGAAYQFFLDGITWPLDY